MDNQREYYVKYLNNQPFPIGTHVQDNQLRIVPIGTVAHLVAAFKQAVPVKLGSVDVDELTLHLPEGISRSTLHQDCFATENENDTTLDPGCYLSDLGAIGLRSKQPLIIKTKDRLPQIGDNPFILNHNLNLRNTEDVIKFLTYEMGVFAPFDPSNRYRADFADNCLEYRLDRRLTSYQLDNVDNIKILLSVSGSGKTRELLELLHGKFGYYFVSDLQSKDFGSGDLGLCHLYSARSPEKVKYYIELLYFIRAFVCSFLVDMGYNTPSQILLAQIHPKAFFGSDLFLKLFESIARFTDIEIGRDIVQLKNCFDFAAIDEIQATLEGNVVFELPRSVNKRPFFSPLVYYSKHLGNFYSFIVSGTGINFHYITELLLSGTMNANQITSCNVISDLKPLSGNEMAEYIRFMLKEHGIEKEEIIGFINAVSTNELFLGRGRFAAFLVDSYIANRDIDLTVSNFISTLSDTGSAMFPLKFLRKDIKENRTNIDSKIVGSDTLGRIVRDGLIQYMMKGKAILNVKDQMASDTIRYGLGFGKVWDSAITSVEMEELAIVECLRYLVPISDLVPNLCQKLFESPKPQMVGIILEYLVAYGIVAKFDPKKAQFVKSSDEPFISYLQSENVEASVFFPDHCCGPDIVFRYDGVIYIIQVKFVDTISKQERVNACHTTDPNYFYWNKKGNCVLKGFENKRNQILNVLKGVRYERVVFLHTNTKTTAGMEDVKIINERTDPKFFDDLNPKVWELLNKIRDNFNQ